MSTEAWAIIILLNVLVLVHVHVWWRWPKCPKCGARGHERYRNYEDVRFKFFRDYWCKKCKRGYVPPMTRTGRER